MAAGVMRLNKENARQQKRPAQQNFSWDRMKKINAKGLDGAYAKAPACRFHPNTIAS
jgi:hypothetical protein